MMGPQFPIRPPDGRLQSLGSPGGPMGAEIGSPNPLDGDLIGMGGPVDDEQEIDKLMNQYTSTGMNPDKARWATAMELKNKEEQAAFPVGNAPPDQPHAAWGGVQTGVTGAGIAAAPFTAGISMPVAGAVNMGIEGLKKLFG